MTTDTGTVNSKVHAICKGDPGERVWLLRRRLGMSQEDLSIASGIALTTIRALEQGRRRAIRDSTLAKLATALGSTVDALRTPID